MNINHIGYAVKNIEKAKIYFEKLGFIFESIIEDEERNILIAFGENDGYKLELVSPIPNSKGSPVDEILKKNGSIPYHVCYVSEDIDKDIQMLTESKFKVIKPLEKAIAFKGNKVAFLYNPYIGLVEIVESKKREEY